MAKDDIRRYENEMNQLLQQGYFVNSRGISTRDLKKQYKDDDGNKIKRFRYPWTFFIMEYFSTVKARNPHLHQCEIMKILII